MSSFAEHLKFTLKQRHVSHERLARRLKITELTVSRWEKGTELPDDEMIKTLSELLNHNFAMADDLAQRSAEKASAAEEAFSAQNDAPDDDRDTAIAISPEQTQMPETPEAPAVGAQMRTPEEAGKKTASDVPAIKREPACNDTVRIEGKEASSGNASGNHEGKAKTGRKKHRLPIAFALVLIAVAAALFVMFMEKTEDSSAPAPVTTTAEPTAEPSAEPSAEPTAEPNEESTAEPDVEPVAESAAEPTAKPSEMTDENITAKDSAARVNVYAARDVVEMEIDTEGEGNAYWEVEFFFENVSDVPFRPDRIMLNYYADERIDNTGRIGYDELRPHMAADKLIKGDDPLCWPISIYQTHFTHIICTIHGTDDNGNDLKFSGKVILSDKIKDENAGIQATEKPEEESASSGMAEITLVSVEKTDREIVLTYENSGNAPFSPELVIVTFYDENDLVGKVFVTQSEILDLMNGRKLIKGENDLRLKIVSGQHTNTRMVCDLMGTDDNGNEMHTTVSVPLH